MSITASLVKELREKTGVGMMECKKALQNCDGDFEKSIKYLREKGLTAAAKKADRAAAEGRIVTKINHQKSVILEINCETDFVAKNQDFIAFGEKVASSILESTISSRSDTDNLRVENKTLTDFTSEYVLKLGENIKINQFEVLQSEGSLSQYVHMNGKIGVLVNGSSELDPTTAKDIAMHIAASSPTYLQKEDVPASEINNEKEIIKNQMKNEGKPEAVVDKIVEGKIQKYFKEVCLLEQPFVKDDKKSIKEILPKGAKISRFIRYSLV